MEKDKTNTDNAADGHLIKNNDNLASHAVASAAFATVGAKLSYLGTFKDIDNILGNQKVSFWQKVKWSVNGTLKDKVREKIHYLKETEQASAIGAFLRLTKVSSTLMGVGAAVGAVVGWVRGGLIDNWKDIIKHPVDSTKIVLGIKEPKKAEDTTLYAKVENQTAIPPMQGSQTRQTSWQDYTKERKENPLQITRG